MRLFRPNVEKMLEKKDFDGLIKALIDRETDIRTASVRGLGVARVTRAVIPLCTAMKDHEPVVRQATAEALGQIGDARAIEPLVQSLRDTVPEVRNTAAAALLKFGAPAVKPLCRLLANEQPEIYCLVSQVLGQLGNADAVKPLSTLLKDAHIHVRHAAALALSQLGPPALEPLCAALGDLDISVREAAADAVEKIGMPNDARIQAWEWSVKQQWARVIPLGALAVEPLCLSLTHPSLEARRNAARGLGEIGDQRATGSLLKCLHDPEWEVRDAVAFAIGLLQDRRAVTPLLTALKDRDPGVREAAAKALGGIGDAHAVEPLMLALHDDEWAVSQAACEALSGIGEAAKKPLAAAVRDAAQKHRKLIATALEKIGVPDEPDLQAWFAVLKGNWEWARSYGELAVEPCIAALQDDDHRTRRCAAELLGDLRDKRAVVPLCAALKDRRPEVRATITEVLGRMGPLVVEPLIIALLDDDWAIRASAAKVLGLTNDERAFEPLSEALRDSDARVREIAANAVDAQGFSLDLDAEYWYAVAKKDWKRAVTLGELSVEPLRNALHDQNGEVRQEAARALGLLGAVSALDDLRAALHDEEWYVRDTAASALEKLGYAVEEPEAPDEEDEQGSATEEPTPAQAGGGE